jgi:ABC-type sulfate/molybdate transport systems ATPase subunit
MSFIGPVNTLRAGTGQSPDRMIRPHEIEIQRTDGHAALTAELAGRVEHVRYLGATTKLEIILADGQRMKVELSRDRFAELALQKGDWVSLEPREAKVFREDYSI